MKKQRESIRTHYDNLQVTRNASDEVIKGAYRYLSQRWHPDKNPDDVEKATRVTRVINRAYEVLIDPTRRLEHDVWIEEQEALQETGFEDTERVGQAQGQQPWRGTEGRREANEAEPRESSYSSDSASSSEIKGWGGVQYDAEQAPIDESNKGDWHYSLNGKSYGPFAFFDLQATVLQRGLTLQTLVWQPGMPAWEPLGDIAARRGYAVETAFETNGRNKVRGASSGWGEFFLVLVAAAWAIGRTWTWGEDRAEHFGFVAGLFGAIALIRGINYVQARCDTRGHAAGFAAMGAVVISMPWLLLPADVLWTEGWTIGNRVLQASLIGVGAVILLFRLVDSASWLRSKDYPVKTPTFWAFASAVMLAAPFNFVGQKLPSTYPWGIEPQGEIIILAIIAPLVYLSIYFALYLGARVLSTFGRSADRNSWASRSAFQFFVALFALGQMSVFLLL